MTRTEQQGIGRNRRAENEIARLRERERSADISARRLDHLALEAMIASARGMASQR